MKQFFSRMSQSMGWHLKQKIGHFSACYLPFIPIPKEWLHMSFWFLHTWVEWISKTFVEQTLISEPSFEWVAQKCRTPYALKRNSTGLLTPDIQMHITTSQAHIFTLLCFLSLHTLRGNVWWLRDKISPWMNYHNFQTKTASAVY